MFKVKILTILVVLSFMAIPLYAQFEESSCYDISGSWMVSHVEGNPFGAEGPFFLVQFNPLDAVGIYWDIDVDGIIGNPSILGLPGVDTTSRFTYYVGILEKTGENQHESKTIGYILNAENELLYYQFVYVTSSFTSCNTMIGNVRSTIYLPSQDKNKDGNSDSDEIPIGAIEGLWSYVRSNQLPPFTSPGITPPALGDVWVTDDLQSTQNLLGGVDENSGTDRCLVINWHMDDSDLDNCHVYVSVDGGPYEYLCHTTNSLDTQMDQQTI